jgi:copper oxidase (laccase) domain-containing protein
VHSALGQPEPPLPTPIDLRGVLASQALDLGLLQSHITRSAFCTLCGGSPFFSHRGGASERQMAFLGIRALH